MKDVFAQLSLVTNHTIMFYVSLSSNVKAQNKAPVGNLYKHSK